MGRRKRRNSDVDLSVEESFERTRSSTPKDDSVRPTVPEDAGVSAEEQQSHKKPKTQNEADKIESLKRKKQERKQRQQEKKMEKQQQAEAARRAQEEIQAQKEREKKEKAEKKKAIEKSKGKAFTTTRKGVQYQDVIVGKGAPVQDRKKVRVAYTLRAKNRYGKILDSSDDFGFRLARGDVIDGWDIGLQGMRQGGKRYLIIPPPAGYGQQNIGAGKGGILFFEVSVLAC